MVMFFLFPHNLSGSSAKKPAQNPLPACSMMRTSIAARLSCAHPCRSWLFQDTQQPSPTGGCQSGKHRPVASLSVMDWNEQHIISTSFQSDHCCGGVHVSFQGVTFDWRAEFLGLQTNATTCHQTWLGRLCRKGTNQWSRWSILQDSKKTTKHNKIFVAQGTNR